mgnify:CR=1 FL=1
MKTCHFLKSVIAGALLPGPLAFAATPVQRSLADRVAALNAPASLVEKMQRGAPLALPDIQDLARHQVPDDTTLAYLRTTNASYSLTTAAIDQLRAAGVSDRVVNHLLLASPMRIVPAERAYAQRSRYGHLPNAGFPPRVKGFGRSFGYRGGVHRGGRH